MESQCDNSNPDLEVDSGGYFGFTERYGNYPGGQAEFLHVPYGNFMPFVIPESCDLEDEALLFLSDVLPTAYWSVENAGVKKRGYSRRVRLWTYRLNDAKICMDEGS